MVAIRSWKYAPILMFAALGGCAGMSEGPVPVSVATDPQSAPIRIAMQDECLARASARPPAPATSADGTALPALPAAATPEDLRARRNNLVTAYIVAADLSYNNYERDLLAFSRQNDLGGSLANQLLSAIGAASGSRALSQATNITSGAVTGTQSAFAKSLLNQTVSVLQTHMRASRAAQYAVIAGRLPLSYADWNTCLALSDALAYEQAGTLNAALAAMAASAAEEERDNDAEARQAIRTIPYARDPLSLALRTYIGRGTAQQTTTRNAITTLINDRVITRSSASAGAVTGYLSEFYTGEGTPAERAALARKIVELENGSEAGDALEAALPQRPQPPQK